MKIVFSHYKAKKFSIIFILTTLFFMISNLSIHNYHCNPIEENNNQRYNEALLLAQDTTAPVISFIQPSKNLTIITENSYLIIVNISDEHLPLYNNVTFQLSNYTSFIFNATMNYTEGTLWNFYWDNISSYINLDWYIIRVWAKDSSLNENIGWSEEYYLYIRLSYTSSPGFFYTIIYFILISLFFAAITIYLNKKGVFTSIPEKKEN